MVLRRYVRPELNAEEPGIATREASTLEHIKSITVPTPRCSELTRTDQRPVFLRCSCRDSVVGSTGGRQTSVAGHVGSPSCSLRSTASRCPEHPVVPTFVPYAQSGYSPPDWARQTRVWERAFEVFHGPVPAGEQVFIQRDFHPGNVLWSKGAVSGVVDWQAACVGTALDRCRPLPGQPAAIRAKCR